MYGNGWAGSTASGVRTGKTLRVEHLDEVLAVVVVELVPVRERDADVFERGRDLLREQLGLAGDELVDARADRAELLERVHAVGRLGADARRDLLLEAGDAHLDELVEVGREDRQELGPLEQRALGVLGQREHPGVEVEPGELAVQQAVLLGRELGRSPRSHRTGESIRRPGPIRGAGRARDPPGGGGSRGPDPRGALESSAAVGDARGVRLPDALRP